MKPKHFKRFFIYHTDKHIYCRLKQGNQFFVDNKGLYMIVTI